MSTLIFQNAVSQYIDDNGKTRMINYKFQGTTLSLMTSPIPPLDLPSERNISTVALKAALKFIKDRKLQITSQDGNEKAIRGLWVEMVEENPGIYYGYIPVAKTDPLKDFDFAEDTKIDPLRTEENVKDSELQIFRRNRKIAEFLKKYTLYTYALNPKTFDETWFVVDSEHEYDIESLERSLFVDGNKVMYDNNGYLIVPSQKIASRLMGYLRIKLANDRPGVLSLVNARKIEDYYQTVSDFTTAPNQLIFTSANGVLRWKRELARVESSRTVSQNLFSQTTEPYFYKTLKIKKGALHLIQNVKDGSLKNAVAVSYKWIKDRVNTGYSEPDFLALPEDISYISYTNNGPVPGGKHIGGTKETASVIFYEDGTYGAILFLA